jgi:Xaa-Pro aminopeptidase
VRCVDRLPSSQSEYVAACDERRAFISGFTGSAGTAVITARDALLWTDGRYYLQASQQLSSQWTLMKSGLRETPSMEVMCLSAAHDFALHDPRVLPRCPSPLHTRCRMCDCATVTVCLHVMRMRRSGWPPTSPPVTMWA